MTTEIREPIDTLGSSRSWSWHFAFVGAATSMIAPGAAALTVGPIIPGVYYLLAALVGGVTGLFYGSALRQLIWYRRGLPFHGLFYWVPLSGGLWGGLVGLVAGVTTLGHAFGVNLILLSAVCGAAVGALQMLWIWHPYVKTRERGNDVTHVVLAAVASAMLLGVLAPPIGFWVLGV